MRKGSKPSWIWAQKDGDEVKKLDDLPTVAQYALDLLCCPVMSAECERVFSGAKLLISPNRNRLADDTIEAAECLRIWWMRGIIED
jgi:hAT family C-terminal dimerisation region